MTASEVPSAPPGRAASADPNRPTGGPRGGHRELEASSRR
jgi:hypothetical protein